MMRDPEPLDLDRPHANPIGEAQRNVVNNLTVLASFAEAIARWRYVQAQGRAERDEAAAQQATRAAEQDELQRRRDEPVIRRHNEAQHRAAAAVYGRASNDEFLLRADLRTLAETWGAAAGYADRDPAAAEAMRRVEVRLRVLQPEAMARYDALREEGATPGHAMFKAMRWMEPPPEQGTDGPTAREGRDRAGAIPGWLSTGGDLVPAGGPGDVPRPPTSAERLEHLRNLDGFLERLEPVDGPGAQRLAEVRASLREDIAFVESVLRGGGRSTDSPWRETPAFDDSVGRWVRAETPVGPTDPAAPTDPGARFNDTQRLVARADFSRAMDDRWLDRASTVELGQAWAAAAAYPADRRAQAALERVEDRLRVTQPDAMRAYDRQLELGQDRHSAMLRAVPLMEGELSSGRLADGPQPRGRYTGDGLDVQPPPGAEPIAQDAAGLAHTQQRLRDLDRHLDQVAAGGPNDGAFQQQVGEGRLAVQDELRRVDAALHPQEERDLDAARGPGRPSGPVVDGQVVDRDALGGSAANGGAAAAGQVVNPDAERAERSAGQLRAEAAADQGTVDSPLTVRVDEHQRGVVEGGVESGDAARNTALAQSLRTPAELAGEGFPQPAAGEVGQARQARKAGPAGAGPATSPATAPAQRQGPPPPAPPAQTPGR